MPFSVSFFRNDPRAVIPEYKTPGACAFDLAPIEDADIQPGELVRLRTGLILCIPEGHVLVLAARSSLPKKHGLCLPHSIGIIDQDFCGPEDELLLQLLNFTNAPVHINAGERLVQGMIIPIERAIFTEVTQLNEQSRGGFGSTGH